MLPNELSIEDRRLFWRNYDKWCAMFGAELVDEQLAKLSVMSIVEERKVPRRDWQGRALDARKPYGVHRELGSQHTSYTFLREDGWQRTERVLCDIYMVSYQYQSTRHGEMIEPIMHHLYPWLAEYKCDFYELNFYPNHVEEFYVRTGADVQGHRSLYVPYGAFMGRYADAIVQRNEKYLREYTRSDDVWNEVKNLPTVVAFLAKVAA